MNRLYRKLPEIIQSALLVSEGWLVGSSIGQILEEKKVNDFDIIVPNPNLYIITCKWLQTLSTDSRVNSFGGMKFELPGNIDIDIWPEELDHFLKNANKLEYFYSMKKNILLKNHE